MTAILETQELCVSYGSLRALDRVGVTVPPGSVVGVLGPNGAGKSTLLRTVAGLVSPSSGTVFFDGTRIDGMRPHEIASRGVCLIPEGRGILPALTVAENLKVAVGKTGAATTQVIERFPVLGRRLEQPAGTLSGGEQQMLALARALDDSARVLLIDEPSLGLAPRLVDLVEQALRDLHGGGRTIVWVEQYASRVLELADVVYVLGRGRVAFAGEPSELRASPVLARSYLGGAI